MKKVNNKKLPDTLFFCVLSIIVVLFSVPVFGNTSEEADSVSHEEGESKTAFIMHHVQDSHEWHWITIGHKHITTPLPVIIYEMDYGFRFFLSSDFVDKHHNPKVNKGYFIDEHGHIESEKEHVDFYDLSITKNVASMLFSVILLMFVFIKIGNRYKKNPLSPPKGIQSLFEPLILFVRDEIAKPNIGEKKHEKFMPYLLTIFFYIFFNNLLGLLPGWANLTGNIAITFTLAIFTFIITTISGNKDYWKHIFNTPGVPWWLKYPVPLMPVIEFVGILTKPFSLMVRLFANITAGHIIILSLIALVYIFNSIAVGPVTVLFGLFMNVVELLVAFIQAFVFTLLSAIYIGLAIEEHHHEEEHKETLKEASV